MMIKTIEAIYDRAVSITLEKRNMEPESLIEEFSLQSSDRARYDFIERESSSDQRANSEKLPNNATLVSKLRTSCATLTYLVSSLGVSYDFGSL
jgi:hypothetical protein